MAAVLLKLKQQPAMNWSDNEARTVLNHLLAFALLHTVQCIPD